MDGDRTNGLGRREMWLGCVVLALIAAATLAGLHGSGLFSDSRYHLDLTQSPHWVAHHGAEFPEDDLLVRYGSFNESPVQNLIYWIGTLFVDVVLLNKLVGIAVFALTAALFFALVGSMSGPRTGTLAALLFMIFPRSTYEIAGGFSKSWAIATVLLAVFVVEQRRWRILLWLMPLGSFFYPVSPVMVGAIVSIGLVLEFLESRDEALRGLKYLAGASAIALVPLLYKYLTPPPFVGEMISKQGIREMWERGESTSSTDPLWEYVIMLLEYPYFIYGAGALLILLWRKGLVWQRSWTALLIASAIAYQVSDFVVPTLYLPDRYIRFSIAVLAVLWFAHNWARVLEGLVARRWLYRSAWVAVIVAAAFLFPETFRPCEGDDDQGLWENRDHLAPISRAVAEQPSPVLVAGHPVYTADVMIQARRPVLTINRMFHAWFPDYRAVLDERHKDIFRALFADEKSDVNVLAERYGVTHLLVRKRDFSRDRLSKGRIYRRQYNEFIASLVRNRNRFVLNPPPRDAVVFDDRSFWLVRLPLE